MKTPIIVGSVVVLAIVTILSSFNPAAARPLAQSAPGTAVDQRMFGRLGAFVQVADACSYYPLTDCSGVEIQVSERLAGELKPYVGKLVQLETVTAICGSGIAGQPLHGPVALRAREFESCPTPEVCPSTVAKAPSAAVAAALANHRRVSGWGTLQNPSVRYHPQYNTFRTHLSVRNPSAPYQPTFNDVVFRAGCP